MNDVNGDKKEDKIVEIVNANFHHRVSSYSSSETRDGLHVYVEARCESQIEKEISPTGKSLICNVGDGIEIRMLEPNSSDPNKYNYVGTLTITKNVKQQKTITDNSFLKSDLKLTEPKLEKSFYPDFTGGGFLDDKM